ncbi:hypothetical protein GGR02_000923 [Anoxybacillus voinovskiensis]|uniref:Uncharacterized protein n=1 Tax=Anoxybacteroides voinovskiense TaxID=230470 RepID=A0A840DNU1_9BACL|nr:hypothetical protein [Anoxybacillus voinovskiensis]
MSFARKAFIVRVGHAYSMPSRKRTACRLRQKS